jgi:hypothetical protein
MDDAPDLRLTILVGGDPDKRAVEVRGRGEPPELVLVERPGLLELEPVQPVRRAVPLGEAVRVGEDHAEDHRPLFFAQEARLVAGGEQDFEDRPFGQPSPVFVRSSAPLGCLSQRSRTKPARSPG